MWVFTDYEVKINENQIGSATVQFVYTDPDTGRTHTYGESNVSNVSRSELVRLGNNHLAQINGIAAAVLNAPSAAVLADAMRAALEPPPPPPPPDPAAEAARLRAQKRVGAAMVLGALLDKVKAGLLPADDSDLGALQTAVAANPPSAVDFVPDIATRISDVTP